MGSHEIAFRDVVNADSSELTNWILMRTGDFAGPLALLYARMRQAALKGELDSEWKLPELWPKLSLDETVWLERMYTVRSQILSRHIENADVQKLLAASSWSRLALGESQCVAAMAYSIVGFYREAKELYLSAFENLRSSAAQVKSLVALQNSIAMESQLYPQKRLIPDYTFLVEEARKNRALSVQGIALINLSREYQLVDSPENAFARAQEGLQLLAGERGTQHYYLALLHYSHLLIDLKRFKEYETVKAELKMSPFKSINEAIKVLEVIRQGINRSIRVDWLTATWKERYKNAMKETTVQFGKMEKLLIRRILDRPQDKMDLISGLYDEPLAFEVLDNRFRNLLARVRKKCPGLILLDDGVYSIVHREDAVRLIEENIA